MPGLQNKMAKPDYQLNCSSIFVYRFELYLVLKFLLLIQINF